MKLRSVSLVVVAVLASVLTQAGVAQADSWGAEGTGSASAEGGWEDEPVGLPGSDDQDGETGDPAPVDDSWDDGESSDRWVEPNDYATTLPPVVVGPTAFEVRVEGPQAVCSMSYGEQMRTAAPWTFEFRPADGWSGRRGADYSEITVHLCDGSEDWVGADAQSAFSVGQKVLLGTARTITVNNRTGLPATVSISTRGGKPLANSTVSPNESGDVAIGHLPSSVDELDITVSTADGLQQQFSVARANGWSVYFPDRGGTVAPCSVIPWTYDDARRPAGASSAALTSDIRGALARISRVTGLTFLASSRKTQGSDASGSRMGSGFDLHFEWRGGIGADGRGWTNGLVQLNPQSSWAGDDANQGFGVTRHGYADRGWLLVHEVLHTLGFEHSRDRASLMYPYNGGQHRFSARDLAGLRAIYPRHGC